MFFFFLPLSLPPHRKTGRQPGPPGGTRLGVLRDADGPVRRGAGRARGSPVAGLVRAQPAQLVRGQWRAPGRPPGELVPRRAPEQPQPADLRAGEVLSKFRRGVF